MTTIEKENKRKIVEKFHEIHEDLKAEYEGKPVAKGIRRFNEGDKFREDQKCTLCSHNLTKRCIWRLGTVQQA